MARARKHTEPDPSEYAASRLKGGLGPFEPLPDELLRMSRTKLLVLVILGLVAFAVLRSGSGSDAPAVKGDCDHPAFALSKTSVVQGDFVSWAVVGPLDAEAVLEADGKQLVGPVRLHGCRAHGRFGIALEPGGHAIVVRLQQPGGTTRDLPATTLRVTKPGG